MSDVQTTSAWRGGSGPNRFGERRIIFVFVALLLVLSAVAVLIAVLGKPASPKSACPKHQVCANPPRGGQTPPLAISPSPRLIFDHEFVSTSLGYRFEYPSELVTTDITPTDVTIRPPRSDAALVITFEAAPSIDVSPQQMLARRVTGLEAKIPDLQADGDPAFQILAPALGYRAGVGGFYRGNEDAPNGFTAPADVAILAATDGQETIAVSVTSTNRDHTDSLFSYADTVLTTLRFRVDVPR
jgi:hypothetical protein